MTTSLKKNIQKPECRPAYLIKEMSNGTDRRAPIEFIQLQYTARPEEDLQGTKKVRGFAGGGPGKTTLTLKLL